MPRTTRAAAKAQEAEIEIAVDETQTEPCHELVDNVKQGERPALAELTANAVEDIELEIALKEDMNATKKGRGTSKKAPAKSLKKTTRNKTSAKRKAHGGNASADESGSASETGSEKTPSRELTGVSETPQFEGEVTGVSAGEIESATSPTGTKAAQKLESLFQEPSEQVSGVPVEGIMAHVADLVDTAAASAVVPPPEKEQALTPPLSSKSKSAGSSKHKTTTTPLSANTLVNKRNVTSTATAKSRASTMARRPSIAPRSTKASTMRARMSSVGTMKPNSPTKKSVIAAATLRTLSAEQESSAPAKDNIKVQKRRPTIAALNTPPKLAKSNKAPTMSTFKLPSEALQEKFKAQREERQKRQEEQAQKQKDSGVRQTIPPKHTTKPRIVPVVKSTKTNASRPSLANTLKERPNGFKAAVEKKALTIKASHRPSLSVNSGNAVKTPRPTAHARNASVAATTKAEIAQPTVLMTATEKADAAKKARAEAAERGRAASKAWAEKKQKDTEAKKAAARVVGEESKENAPVVV